MGIVLGSKNNLLCEKSVKFFQISCESYIFHNILEVKVIIFRKIIKY